MIFVTVGTQANGFLRCLQEVEKLINDNVITEDVVAQIGNTDFSTDKFTTVRFVKENEFKQYINQASVVITHAGSGAIFNAIKAGKKTIAMARLHDFKEMIDNHQLDLVRKLSESGYILDGSYSLAEAWAKIKDFCPRREDFSCTIVNELRAYINEILCK